METPCIEWTGCMDGYGYGKKGIDGKEYKAHRLAYCQHHGVTLESIQGVLVRHACDNRKCVNPEHLLLGTHKDNSQDMKDRGRSCKGVDRHNARLTEAQIAEIRRIYVPRDRNFGARSLGRTYGVSYTTIGKVVRGETWTHVKD